MERNQQWKNKVQELFNTCQEELRRTTEIGKKMLSASKTNGALHEAYEELGQLVARALENNELKWENSRVAELLNTIQKCQEDLEVIEGEVNKIKFAAAPTTVGEEQGQPTAKTPPPTSIPTQSSDKPDS